MKTGNNRGFTLIELVVVIAIMGIVGAIAVLNMIGWRGERQLEGAARSFFSDMQLARLQAIREAENVSVVVNVAAGSYQVFVDVDKDYSLDAEDRSIRNITLPRGVTIQSTTFNGDQTRFDTRGRPLFPPDPDPDPDSIGRVTFLNSRGNTREVHINLVGRLRLN